MATIKIQLKTPAEVSSLAIRVLHAGRGLSLVSKERIPRESFVERSGRIRDVQGVLGRTVARRLNEALLRTTALLQQRIDLLEASGLPYTVEEVCEGFDFQGEAAPHDLFTFFRIEIAGKAAHRKYASQQLYTAALHALQDYVGRAKYPFASLTREFVAGYLEYLGSRELAPGTVAKYMAVVHTVCLRAVRRGVTINREQLFGGLHPIVGHTAKRAVDKSILARIFRLDLAGRPVLKYASDLFLFSFFAQGMSLVDILHLRRENIQDGQIRYSRAKCGTPICLGITPQMQRLIDTYDDTNDGCNRERYLFPTLRGIQRGSVAEYKAYRAALRATNRALLKISDMLHLEVPLTTYVARHTWATNAKKSRIPLPVIQEALGHTSIRTTEIYLRQFETRMIDRINERITRL